jgi:hypothetical protein
LQFSPMRKALQRKNRTPRVWSLCSSGTIGPGYFVISFYFVTSPYFPVYRYTFSKIHPRSFLNYITF